jgi:hypothetical protein
MRSIVALVYPSEISEQYSSSLQIYDNISGIGVTKATASEIL